MSVADVARRAESKFNALAAKRAIDAGWTPKVEGYTGFGNTEQVRVIGRVLMQKPGQQQAPARGFRQFLTIEVADHPVEITAGNRTACATSDRNGYVEALVKDHGLAPGWHEVTIGETKAEVLIIDPATKYGIVSDIDDTVLVTMLPRALIAAYNSWFIRTDKRKAVPGFAEFYAQLRGKDAPVIYLSTGAWNTFGTLTKFLHKHGLPKGPLLLTDWGPTATGLFRSGQEHKKVQLRNLFIDFPDIKWILVGDDGQHDPLIYGTAAAEHPDKVAGIAIRNLTPSEHVLSHGTTVPIEKLENTHVPFIEGADGFALLEQLDRILQPESGDEADGR